MPEAVKNLRPLTKKEILNAKYGDILYSQDGHRWRVTSVRTWVRKPEDRRFGLKYGLYGYDSVEYIDGRLNYPMMAGPDTRIEAEKVVRGMPKVGQTVVLVKPFQEHTIHPENDKPELPAGTKGVVKGVRLIEEQHRPYLSEDWAGSKGALVVAFKGHYTSYNVPSGVIKLSKGRRTAKPRLSR